PMNSREAERSRSLSTRALIFAKAGSGWRRRPAEHEFVTPQSVATRQCLKIEGVMFIEPDHIVRPRDLERIATDPIDQVVPRRHSACRAVLTKSRERAPVDEVAHDRWAPEKDHDRSDHDEVKRSGQRVVCLLDEAPDATLPALIVIYRDVERSAWCDECGDQI